MKIKVLLFLFFAAVFINFLGPIDDPDFPFHLKTGEYIWQHREIPGDDPFSFYGEGVVTDRERFTLSQYWIAQLIFYKLYSVTGPSGIIILRASVFSVFIFLLWFVLRKRGMYSAMIITTLTAIMFQSVNTDRPQFFSFLFTLMLVLLLEQFREKPELHAPLFFIPPLMLLWANMHAGFVFGIAVIVIYTSAEVFKVFIASPVMGDPLDKKAVLFLSLTTLVAVLFSYINPDINGQILTTIESHADPEYATAIYGTNREYLSPVQEMGLYYGNRVAAPIFFALFGFTCMVSLLHVTRTKTVDTTVLALVVFSSIAAFTSLRYIPFFVATALPLSRHYRFIGNSALLSRLRSKNLLYVLFGMCYLSAMLFGLRDYQRIFTHDTSTYPEKAAAFLLENRIGGNIFNQFNKGSYLLWRLYPHYRLFNDTRFIDLGAVKDTDIISNAISFQGEPYDVSLGVVLSDFVPESLGRIDIAPKTKIARSNSVPLWKKLLDQYKIDLIVHEACQQYSKGVFPLILRLVKDDAWSLVHLDGQMLIFIRNKDEYADVIRKFRLPKALIYDEIILETLPVVRTAPSLSSPYSSLSFAYLMKGEDEKAKKMIDAALEIDKNDILAHFGMAYLALKQYDKDRETKSE